MNAIVGFSARITGVTMVTLPLTFYIRIVSKKHRKKMRHRKLVSEGSYISGNQFNCNRRLIVFHKRIQGFCRSVPRLDLNPNDFIVFFNHEFQFRIIIRLIVM